MIDEKYAWIHQPAAHIRIPKALFYSPLYNWMHPESMIIYAALQDRLMLSLTRGGERYRDERGDVYVIFPQTEVMDRLHCGHDLAGMVMKELVQARLIRVERIGCGKPHRIYVLPVRITMTGKDHREASEQRAKAVPMQSYCPDLEAMKDRIGYSVLIRRYPQDLVERFVEVLYLSSTRRDSDVYQTENRMLYGYELRQMAKELREADADQIMYRLVSEGYTSLYTDFAFWDVIMEVCNQEMLCMESCDRDHTFA